MSRAPTGSAGVWWAELGDDFDLVRCGVVLDAPKFTEIRAHNTDVERARLRAVRCEAEFIFWDGEKKADLYWITPPEGTW